MTLRLGFLLLTVGCAACFSDPTTPQRISGESMGSSTGGGSTGNSQGTDGSNSESESSTSLAESSSSGEPGFGCGQALDAESCSAASDPASEECSWYPTIGHDLLSCEPWDTDSGACVIEQGLDGCSEPDPTCPDGSTWFYRVVDGSVELIDTSNLCYGLTEFTPCPEPSFTGSGGSSTDGGTSTGGETEGSGSADTGASGGSLDDGGASGTSGGTSGGTTGDGLSLEEEIEAVCACACE